MEGTSPRHPTPPTPPSRRGRRRRLALSTSVALLGLTVSASAAFGGLDKLADSVRDNVYCKVVRDCVYDEPTTKIVKGPDGRTDDSTPTFHFALDEKHVSFRCRTDSAPFRDCKNPHTTARLDDGRHVLEVYAVDRDGNPDRTPASREFIVDTEDPDCTAIRGPKSTRDRTPVFGVRSSERGSRFQYRLDHQGGFHRTGQKVKLRKLRPGKHVLEVRSVDKAGNHDRSPAKREFRVVGKRHRHH